MATYYVDGSTGVDANAGSSGSPWLTIAHGLASIASGDILGVRNTVTYSIGTGLTASVGSYQHVTRMVGCTTTVGDGGVATIRATAAVVGLTISGVEEFTAENFIFDGNSVGTKGVVTSGGSMAAGLVNCVIENWTQEGWSASSQVTSKMIGCEVTNCGGTTAAVSLGGGSLVYGCRIHGNSKPGIVFTSSYCVVLACRIYANTGHGIIYNNQYPLTVIGNTIDNNTGDGLNASEQRFNACYDNIFTRNGAYGLNASGLAASAVDPAADYNWFGTGSMANTSGARSANLLAGPHDLSGDPQYNNAAAGDFTPTNAAVQAGFP